MKKFLLTLLLTVLVFPSIVIANEQPTATVFHPETLYRKSVVIGASDAFDGGYLLEVARVVNNDGLLGFSVVTDYKTTLSSSISKTQSTIPASSVTTKDDHTLTMDDLGSKVFFVIEPGGRKEEIVMCTGISSSNWTGCTRGLAFYGSSTASVAANRETHNSGATLVLSNTHYVYEELVDKDADETIQGIKTFGSFPKIATSTAIPTVNAEFANKYYVDQVGAGGFTAVNASTTQGLQVYGTVPETVGINASTTRALAFDEDGAIYVKASSTANMAFDNDGELYFTGDDDITFTGELTIGGKDIEGGLSKFGGTGADGALSVTSGTTTLNAAGAVVLTKNYSSISIATSSVLTISNESATGTILILKSIGDCLLSGDINLQGKGANAMITGYSILDSSEHSGIVGPAGEDDGTGGASSTANVAFSSETVNFYITRDANLLYRKFINVTPGSGGGTGGTGGDSAAQAGGSGGAGGGAIIIECGGTLNFTSGGTINVNGVTGLIGEDGTGSGNAGGGGGGGGSAGMALILYNTLGANNGTITAIGGAGGDGGIGGIGGVGGDTAGGGTGGSGGSSMLDVGSLGGDGGSGDGGGGDTDAGEAGIAGVKSAGGGGGGGGGGVFVSTGGAGGAADSDDPTHYLVVQNTVF